MSLPWMPFGFKPYGPEHDGGVTYDTATTAWVNAVVADGGAVSNTQKGRVDTLITGLRTDGLFTILQRLWLYGGESDAHQAKIDIINLATHTLISTPTLAAGGYTGNGTTQCIDTGYNVNTTGSLNSFSFGSYVRGTTTGTICEIGATISSVVTRLIPTFGGTLLLGYINTNIQDSPSNTNAQGFFIGSRTGATANAYYRNGTSLGTTVSASTSKPNGNLYVLAENQDSTAINFSPNQSAAAFIGGALNSTQAGNLSTRLNTYMTSWGINVY